MGGSFLYLIKQGAKNITLNALMSLASVAVLVACMLLMGCSTLFGINVQSIIGYVETQNEVSVFIHREVTEEDLAQLAEEIAGVNNLLSYTYIDKDMALTEWISGMGDDGDLMEVFRYDNPLPASYRVVIRDLSKIRETVETLSTLTGVELVNAPYDVADSVTNIKVGVDNIGNAIIIMLFFVSLVVLTNTVKITVFNRRKEISIMKYVGATDAFIRLPFFIEGILLGIIAAVISFALIAMGYSGLMAFVQENPMVWGTMVSEQLVPFGEYSWRILGGFLLSGTAVGGLGSMLFIGKYIKV